MKILYINALYDPYIAGGAEISLKLIVEGMQARGHEVSVLSMKPEPGLQTDSVNGIRVYRAGLHNRYWPFQKERPGKLSRLAWHLQDRYNRSMQTYVREVLRVERPAVVSCHNLVGWSVAVWDEVRRAEIPVVQVLHDMYLLSPNSTLFSKGHSGPKRSFMERLLRIGYRQRSNRLTAVVGISRSILNRFASYGYFTQTARYVVHNARVIPESNPLRLRVADQPLTVGYIGTLSTVKGVAWLIHQFRQSGIDGTLRIAGRGKEEDERYLNDLAEGDSRIVFAGYADPQHFYRNIDVLVVPSLWEEPLGMVAVEGLANNLPVIASNRGGLRETVKDGKNGILCDPSESDSLGRALRMVWQDVGLYNRLAKEARASVAEYISVERMVSEYENILETARTAYAGK
ncbi:glycosyltransferase family 4 protein [Parapedobacter deserti]|uniref:Glycosyltransferase family 4 protein n=1 Tax=Parapedobacter deserti TaxID=1912957 RepID=A0ABV7JQV5_9SPHI